MACTLLLWLASSFSLAEGGSPFDLNFEPVAGADFIGSGGGGYANTTMPFICPDAANPDCLIGGAIANVFGGGEAGETDPNTSFFINERIGDNFNAYWHLVIGDPSEGFAQEVYIPMTRFYLSNSGGHEPIFFRLNGNLEQQSGNGWDPLEFNQSTFGSDNTDFSGNGSGDPTKVMVRQLLGNGKLVPGTARVRDWVCDPGQFCQEFLKSEFNYKPIITQQFDEAFTTLYFELDMSNIDYNDRDTEGTIVNTLTISDPDIPSDSSTFDMGMDSDKSIVSGGRYTYTPGIGWYDDTGDHDGTSYDFQVYASGSYDYWGGDFDQINLDWSSFYDPSQNAYSGNEAKCAALSLAYCDNPLSTY